MDKGAHYSGAGNARFSAEEIVNFLREEYPSIEEDKIRLIKENLEQHLAYGYDFVLDILTKENLDEAPYIKKIAQLHII